MVDNKTKNKKTETVVDYGFYSKLLKKPFDTLDELKEAEAQIRAEQAAKEAKIMERKNDADKVQAAFTALNAAKDTYNKEVNDAKYAYTKLLADAKVGLAECLEKSEKKLELAEKAYGDALKEFTDKHPEGYHVTLKDGDNVTTISRSSDLGTDNLRAALNELFKIF